MDFCFPPALARLHDYSERAPTVATQHMLDPLDGDVITENLTEERQLAAAELRAELRGPENRAVVFYEIDRPLADAPGRGHVAFLASDPRKGGHALSERQVPAGHPRAIAFHLLPRPLGGQAFQAFVPEGALNRLEHLDRELRVGVRESIVGVGRDSPYACGPTNLPPLIREVDQPLSLKDGEVLADRHGGNVQPLPHPRRGLGPVHLQLDEDTVPTGTGSRRVHAGNLHGDLRFSKFTKYILYKDK